MLRARRLTFAVPLLLLLAAGSIPQGKGDTVVVTRKETKIRAQKRLFAPAVATVKEGDRLLCLDKDGAWLSVKFQDVTGWLHASDVSTNQSVQLSNQGVRENYSASEAAAARKGFNPEVEKQYREQNPDLTRGFTLVDQIQAGKPDEAAVQTFLQSGGLLPEGGR